MDKPSRPQRADFPHIQSISTRWTDNDVYGHVNNAIYYQYFDSVINAYLIAEGGLDTRHGTAVGFIVSSSCDFFAPVAYPASLAVGVAVAKLGRSSVTYRTGLFADGMAEACACGSMVHVFVDSASRQPVAIPPVLRAALQCLQPPPVAADGSVTQQL